MQDIHDMLNDVDRRVKALMEDFQDYQAGPLVSQCCVEYGDLSTFAEHAKQQTDALLNKTKEHKGIMSPLLDDSQLNELTNLVANSRSMAEELLRPREDEKFSLVNNGIIVGDKRYSALELLIAPVQVINVCYDTSVQLNNILVERQVLRLRQIERLGRWESYLDDRKESLSSQTGWQKLFAAAMLVVSFFCFMFDRMVSHLNGDSEKVKLLRAIEASESKDVATVNQIMGDALMAIKIIENNITTNSQSKDTGEVTNSVTDLPAPLVSEGDIDYISGVPTKHLPD